MAKARIPAVDITFGTWLNPKTRSVEPKHRRLIYDYNALAELQDIAGTYRSSTPTMKALRAILWAGLLAETLDERGRETGDTLSLVEVGEILFAMDEVEVERLKVLINDAKRLAEPGPSPNPQAGETTTPQA